MTTVLGIPYARASVDERGIYSKTCPVCGETFSHVDESQETLEDAITKGASQAYGIHYLEKHQIGA